MSQSRSAFWSVPATDLLRQLGATPQGLASTEAGERLTRFGANLLAPRRRTDELALLLGQFKSPWEPRCTRSMAQRGMVRGRPNVQYCFGTARPDGSPVHAESLRPSPPASTMA